MKCCLALNAAVPIIHEFLLSNIQHEEQIKFGCLRKTGQELQVGLTVESRLPEQPLALALISMLGYKELELVSSL